MIWIKFALREIFNNSRFSWFFIINLLLGLVGFIALDSFKISIHTHIANRSKAMFSADIDVRSPRVLTGEDIAFLSEKIGPFQQQTRRLEFLSMVAGGERSRLVQIVAIDKGYPLYGQIDLGGGKTATKAEINNQLLEQTNIWVQPELLVTLGVKVGDELTIGKIKFKIAETVVDAPGSSFAAAGFAYQVFMGMDQAEKTGLIRFGSRRRHHYLYTIPEEADLKLVVSKLRNAISERYGPSSHLSVRTHQNADRQTRRFMGYLNDYLGLVSMVALFLAGVGTAYLFRSYLGSRIKEMAILLSLGATKTETYLMLGLQIAILGSVAALAASGLAVLFLPVLTALLKEFLPTGFVSYLSWRSIVLAVGMGMLGSILFCLPVMVRLHQLKPQALFRENEMPGKISSGFSLPSLISYIPLIAVYWSLAAWQSHSWKIGSTFMGSLIGSILALAFIGWGMVWLAGRFFPHIGLIYRLAFRNLYRNRISMLSSFLAIGLGALLINLIPQIHKGITDELRRPESMHFPSFFFFDIQPEQVAPFKAFLAEKNYAPENISPWIESRLTKINGKEPAPRVEQKGGTREQQREGYARRRTQNISYRLGQFDSEKILSGEPFSGVYNPDSGKKPEISIEEWFANALKINVGDELTFDIQGIPIAGNVVNIRKIDWNRNSFRPNFYILFQPGVLEDAPSTFLATLSGVQDGDRVELQNEIIKRFPNITMVDVTQAVAKFLDITNQISWAVEVMAFLAVMAGLIVVYSISRYNSLSRQQEINLLKVLGANFNDIRKMIIIEFGLLGLLASTLGSVLSLIASWVISYVAFESIWSVYWQITLLTIAVISLFSMTAAFMGARKTLKQKPIGLLQAV